MEMRSIRTVRTSESARPIEAMRWGPIFAGGLLTLALSAFFSFLAIGLQIGGFNLLRPTADTTVGEAIYSIASVILSVAVGAYVAARAGGFTNRRMGALQGLTAWAGGSGLLAVAAAGFTGFYLVATPGMGWVLVCAHLGGALVAAVAGAAGCVARGAAVETTGAEGEARPAA